MKLPCQRIYKLSKLRSNYLPKCLLKYILLFSHLLLLILFLDLFQRRKYNSNWFKYLSLIHDHLSLFSSADASHKNINNAGGKKVPACPHISIQSYSSQKGDIGRAPWPHKGKSNNKPHQSAINSLNWLCMYSKFLSVRLSTRYFRDLISLQGLCICVYL